MIDNTIVENPVAVTTEPQNNKTVQTYSKKERNLYLFGLMGQNIIYNIIGACFAYFMQFTILIPAMSVTWIMTAARIWDAFNDPMMGTIVDRTRTKFGKCRPYLIAVPIPIMIITILCFVAPFGFYGDISSLYNGLVVAWAAFTYILWGMTYTIGDIPLWGVTALMTEDEKDRNSLLSLARIAGGIGGGIVLLAMQPIALAVGGAIGSSIGNPMKGEYFGFLIIAAVFAIMGAAMFQVCGPSIKERVPASEKKNSLIDNFKTMFKNKPFRQLLISGVLGSPKSLLMMAAMPLVTYYFASKSPILGLVYMALLGGGMFVGMFVAMGIIPKLIGRFEKKTLYNVGNLAGVIPYGFIFVAYLISPINLVAWYWLLVCFLLFLVAGASMGVYNVMQSSMIADCVDYEEYQSGTRPDGVFFSGQTLIVKLQAGIATILAGIAYTYVSFSDSRVAEVNAFISAGGVPRLAGEYSSFMMILFFIVSIPPAIGSILTVIPTWKYYLTDKRHTEILAELCERREKARLIAAGACEEGESIVDVDNVSADVEANDSISVNCVDESDDKSDKDN